MRKKVQNSTKNSPGLDRRKKNTTRLHQTDDSRDNGIQRVKKGGPGELTLRPGPPRHYIAAEKPRDTERIRDPNGIPRHR